MVLTGYLHGHKDVGVSWVTARQEGWGGVGPWVARKPLLFHSASACGGLR